MVFWPVTGFDFINYDDPEYYYENPRVIRGLSIETVGWAFRTTDNASWYPITWLSYLLDATAFGRGAFGPHFTNLLLHTANAVLVFILLNLLSAACSHESGKNNSSRCLFRNALLAALFALHPMRVESVAWVSERKGLLCALFGLVSLICYVRWAGPRAQGSRPGVGYYRASIIFLALGLMSKPMLVTLPFVFLLLDFWPLRRFSISHLQLSDLRRLLIEKIPFLALAAVFSVVTFLVHKRMGVITSMEALSLGDRISNAFVSYARYLGKTFWPVNLALPYPHPGQWPAAWVVLSVCVVVAVCAIALALVRRHPWVCVGSFWFFGMLVPVIGVVGWGDQSMADRFTYLPSIGLLLALGLAASEFCRVYSLPGFVSVGISLVVIGACCSRTSDQLMLWRDSQTLFSHAIEVTDGNEIAHGNLGALYSERGDVTRALLHYRKALDIKPEKSETHQNIAVVLSDNGRYEEAIELFQQAIRLNPKHVIAHVNLAETLVRAGRVDQAVSRLQEAISLAPLSFRAHHILGLVLFDQGRTAEALPYLSEAVRLFPDSSSGHYDMGRVLYKLDRHSEAVAHFEQAVKYDSQFAEARNFLAVILLSQGRPQEAISHFQILVRSDPNDINVRANLGLAYAMNGDTAKAADQLALVVHLVPDDVDVRFNFANVLATQRRFTEAIEHYQKVLQLVPDHAAAHNNLGHALADAGRRLEAIVHLRQSLRLQPDNHVARQKLESMGIVPESTSD